MLAISFDIKEYICFWITIGERIITPRLIEPCTRKQLLLPLLRLDKFR